MIDGARLGALGSLVAREIRQAMNPSWVNRQESDIWILAYGRKRGVIIPVNRKGRWLLRAFYMLGAVWVLSWFVVGDMIWISAIIAVPMILCGVVVNAHTEWFHRNKRL